MAFSTFKLQVKLPAVRNEPAVIVSCTTGTTSTGRDSHLDCDLLHVHPVLFFQTTYRFKGRRCLCLLCRR